jgi:uncharacterized protein (TIGR04222 family)
MARAAATADTWGISGPTFLLAYLLIATAVGVAAARERRALAEPRAPRPVDELLEHPHDVAYLNGGGELAVYAALCAMHLRGTITTARGSVRAVGRLGHDADALERAIHTTAAGGVARRRLLFHRPVQTALAVAEDRLIVGGFLLSEERRRHIRRVGTWMLAVALLGLVRVLAGVAQARPVGLLVVALLVVTAVAVLQFHRAPQRSRHGDRVLRGLRAQHEDLAPESEPDWHLQGPAAAALGIGIFGTRAVWASDPGFAETIAAPRAIAGDGRAAAVGGGGDGG